MSLARAFTKRLKRSNDDGTPSTPARGNTVRYTPGTINRNNISLPTELISTTNVQALTAPDIRKVSETSSSSSSSSTHSGHDSDFSTIDRSFLNGDSSPPTPITPPTESEKGFFEVPIIPQRAPSHSKKAHMELSRKLSVQRMSPPPSSLTRARSTRVKDEITQKSEDQHPFGPELAQVNEIAEGFGGRAIIDEEEQFMYEQGLAKFSVEDYINEIQQLYGGVFEDQLGHAGNPWM